MPTLDAPLTLRCGLELRNRAALAPMTNKQSEPDGTLSDFEAEWLLARARGGFGLLSTCAAWVCEEGKAWQGQLGVAGAEHDAGLKRLASGLSAAGAQPIVQLHHGGIKAEIAPGDRLSTADGEGVRGATEADLQRVKQDFVDAALRAQAAGFDGVEIHGANGYLFTQFLAPADNPRTDAYGGDLVGRARFLRETLRAVREAVRPSFCVGVRISPVDAWTRRGLVLDDGVQVARWMAEDGADFVHLSLGDASAPPQHEAEAPVVVSAVREAVPDEVAIVAAGGITTRAQAERVLDLGADVVAVARAAIRHADWASRALSGDLTYDAPPWRREDLVDNAVSERFLAYLAKFRGLLEA